jgi:hypothetical protein
MRKFSLGMREARVTERRCKTGQQIAPPAGEEWLLLLILIREFFE